MARPIVLGMAMGLFLGMVLYQSSRIDAGVTDPSHLKAQTCFPLGSGCFGNTSCCSGNCAYVGLSIVLTCAAASSSSSSSPPVCGGTNGTCGGTCATPGWACQWLPFASGGGSCTCADPTMSSSTGPTPTTPTPTTPTTGTPTTPTPTTPTPTTTSAFSSTDACGGGCQAQGLCCDGSGECNTCPASASASAGACCNADGTCGTL